MQMRLIIDLVEGLSPRTPTTTLRDIYGFLPDDEDEAIYHFVGEDDMDVPFHVMTLTPEQCMHLKTTDGDTTVWDAFRHYADRDQKALVNAKRASDFDADRVVVLNGQEVLDGYHHIVAAILDKKPVLAIDLTQAREPVDEVIDPQQ